MFSPSPDLNRELKRHETIRIEGENFEHREYDTGQTITRAKVIVRHGDQTGPGESEAIRTIVRDRRSGNVSYTNPDGGGGVHHERFRDGYPELSEFALALGEQFKTSRRVRISPGEVIGGLIGMMLGHTRMEPLEALHPVTWMDLIKATTIGHKEVAFDLKKGFKAMRKGGDLIESDQVNIDTDRFVARIEGLTKGGETTGRNKLADGLKITIFNPSCFGSPALDPIPGPRNTFFEVIVHYNPEEQKLELSLANRRYDSCRQIRNELLVGGKPEPFVKIDNSLIDTLCRLAPLPIEHSDCGAQLGFPDLNQALSQQCSRFEEISNQAVIEELKVQNSDVIDFLNDLKGWNEVQNLKQFIGKLRANDPKMVVMYDHDTNKMVAKEVPVRMAERARRIIELCDGQLSSIGLRSGSGLYIFIDPCFHNGLHPRLDA